MSFATKTAPMQAHPSRWKGNEQLLAMGHAYFKTGGAAMRPPNRFDMFQLPESTDYMIP